jgi:hypothetical protein
VVVGPGREICVISDRHVGILNAVREVIPNHSRVHHHWCTRHLAQKILLNFDYVVAPNIYLDTKRYEVRAQGMHATCFYIQAQKYEVIEGSRMTSGSEHHGAKRFVVNISENTCTCGVPQLIHVLCPHTIVVCNLLGRNFYMPPFMGTYNTLEALIRTWSPRFVPVLDEEQ